MNKDYGQVIDQWAKENPHMCIGPFEHKLMEKTILSSLEIQLGKPYVYMHLGTCEHLIVFTDARYWIIINFFIYGMNQIL